MINVGMIRFTFASTKDSLPEANTYAYANAGQIYKNCAGTVPCVYAVLGPTASKTLEILLTIYNEYPILRLKDSYLQEFI